jgi:hypothetical protein
MTGPRRDASGDRLADLYDRFAGTLFRHAAMILADRTTAADVVHTVFLRLAKAGSGGDVEPLAYLRRAVRNECYGVMRTRRREIVIAVERYRRDHGDRLPDDLQALVPVYLPAAPLDPFSGKEMRFTKDAGGYVAYSVGSNRRDDGGDVTIGWRDGDRSADPGIRIRYAQ